MNKTCIIVAGPTAVGKTAVALHLAQLFSTTIISSDSRQCYRELNIGVAKPEPEELEAVHHHFINSHSIHESLNAADFEKYALKSVEKIFQKSDIAIMVGGTGLYIKAFCEGLDKIPEVPAAIREQIIQDYQTNGIEWLSKMLQEKDDLYAVQGNMQNPQRMMRALEIISFTGNSILSYQTHQKEKRNFNIIKIGLELPRLELYERINSRVDKMIADGLIQEASTLQSYQHLNALQTVGYSELFDYFNGKISKEKAIEMIKQNTRHYAKRQMTWFKKDEEMTWFLPNDDMVKEWIITKI
jgi:tRNA dimethylallyltransferase